MWIRFTERSDVLSSLRQLNRSLKDAETETGSWKWVLLALFSALHGAAVCNLSGTAQIGALSEKSAKQTYEALKSGKPSGKHKERLADPSTLICRITTADERIEEAGPIISMSKSQMSSFHLLLGIRNQFSHYTPILWSIEKAGLPQMGLDLLSVIKDIFQDGWSFRHSDDQERLEIRNLLLQAETAFLTFQSSLDE